MAVYKIQKATRENDLLRICLYGGSGSGKTYTSLLMGTELARITGKRLGVIDSQHGQARKYAHHFDFDVIELRENFSPVEYCWAMKTFKDTGEHGVLILDSLTHEWSGTGGCLEQVNGVITRWATVRPLHNKFIDFMLALPMHVIGTMRAKTEYQIDKPEHGPMIVTEMGLEPIQDSNMKFEFDYSGPLSTDHEWTLLKSIGDVGSTLEKGRVITRPGAEVIRQMLAVGQMAVPA